MNTQFGVEAGSRQTIISYTVKSTLLGNYNCPYCNISGIRQNKIRESGQCHKRIELKQQANTCQQVKKPMVSNGMKAMLNTLLCKGVLNMLCFVKKKNICCKKKGAVAVL